MFCAYCGKDIGTTPSKFCPKCGSSIRPSEPSADASRSALEAVMEPLRACDLPNARVAMERAERLCRGCSDIWYMKALLSVDDQRRRQMCIAIGDSGSYESRGVFVRENIDMYLELWKDGVGDIVRRARTFLEKGDTGTVSRLLERASTMDPGCSDIWYMRSAIAGNDEWKRNFVLAGDGSPRTLHVFGKDDISAVSISRTSEVTFVWSDPPSEQAITVRVGSEALDLNPCNNYCASMKIVQGAYDAFLEVRGGNGSKVGGRHILRVLVNGDCTYSISFGGPFRTKAQIRQI